MSAMSCEKQQVDKSTYGNMRVQYEIRFLLFTLSKWYHINTQQSILYLSFRASQVYNI